MPPLPPIDDADASLAVSSMQATLANMAEQMHQMRQFIEEKDQSILTAIQQSNADIRQEIAPLQSMLATGTPGTGGSDDPKGPEEGTVSFTCKHRSTIHKLC